MSKLSKHWDEYCFLYIAFLIGMIAISFGVYTSFEQAKYNCETLNKLNIQAEAKYNFCYVQLNNGENITSQEYEKYFDTTNKINTGVEPLRLR